MKNWLNVYLTLFVAIGGCGSTGTSQVEKVNKHLPYNLNAPSKTLLLSRKLDELSGLAFCDGKLWGIDDEHGVFYQLSLEDGAVISNIEWGEKRDYEGVSCLNGEFFALESDGDIYQITLTDKDPRVVKHETRLGKACDAEGLCTLPDEEALLVACKEGKGDKRDLHRFKISKGEIDEDPYLTLHSNDVLNYIDTELLQEVGLKIKEFLTGEKDLLSPSAIAFHPLSNDLYIINGKDRLLLVYDRAGRLKMVHALENEALPQPEAITFLPNGDLLIGSEGNGTSAAILIFTYEHE